MDLGAEKLLQLHSYHDIPSDSSGRRKVIESGNSLLDVQLELQQ